MIAHDRRGCKGCRPDYQVTEEAVQRLLAASTLPLEQQVSARVYTERLQACHSCPRLHSDGFTCSLCGCIVRVMARDRARSCPHTGAPRWSRPVS